MARTPLFKSLRKIIRKSAQGPAYHEKRRKFLQYMGTGFATTSLAGLSNTEKFVRQILLPKPMKQIDPVIVLGGGIAGLTAAYRLKQQGIPCALFESSSRLGGRIFSQYRFNAEGMFCELGGELIDTEHEAMLSLAQELNVPVDDFLTIDHDVELFHFFFNGVHYFEKDAVEAFKPLARHLDRDMKRAFFELEEKECNYKRHTPFAAELDQISFEQYLYSMTDVDRWVLDLINVAYTGEYGADICDQSAMNLLSLIGNDFSEEFSLYDTSDESKRIRGGNSKLIEAIEEAITPTVPIHLAHQLIAMNNKTTKIGLVFKTPAGTKEIFAERVICTIPFTTLRLVEGIEQVGFTPRKLKCIQEMGCGWNTKFMMGFSSKRWRDPKGPIVPSNGYCYSDLESQTFWETSRMQNGNSGILTNFIGGKVALKQDTHRLQNTLSELDKIYPGIRQDYDGHSSLFQWGNYRHALGSYTSPKPGQMTTLVGSAGEPELGDRMFFAGEHVSELFQGYMNGAVDSANEAAALIQRQVYGQATT